MSNRDAEPAVSKPVGALPPASIERSAVARPHWTYAAAAAQLPPPPVLPLRPRPEAASQVGRECWTRSRCTCCVTSIQPMFSLRRKAEPCVAGATRLSLHCSAARWGCPPPPCCRHQQALAALLRCRHRPCCSTLPADKGKVACWCSHRYQCRRMLSGWQSLGKPSLWPLVLSLSVAV